MALLSAVFSLAEEYRILLDYSYGKLQPRLSSACTVGLIDVYFLTYVAFSVYESEEACSIPILFTKTDVYESLLSIMQLQNQTYSGGIGVG